MNILITITIFCSLTDAIRLARHQRDHLTATAMTQTDIALTAHLVDDDWKLFDIGGNEWCSVHQDEATLEAIENKVMENKQKDYPNQMFFFDKPQIIAEGKPVCLMERQELTKGTIINQSCEPEKVVTQFTVKVAISPLPRIGDRIEMVVDMQGNGGIYARQRAWAKARESRQLTQGMQGVVTKIDKDGDFLIQFDDIDGDEDWIRKENIGNIRRC